jgi:YHS domain-containing protein
MFPIDSVASFKAVVAAALIAMLSLAWAGSAVAGGKVNTGYFGGVAIKGYDPVAYFTEGRAVKGSPDFHYEFLGETWYFASAESRDAFAANPVAYAPQYGGYCAGEVLAADVTSGITTNIDPEAWRIIDGNLYLFYDRGYAKVFEENAKELVQKANGNWPKVEARLASQ